MNFKVSSSALYSRLTLASKVLASKNVLPILDCFLFDIKDGNIISDGIAFGAIQVPSAGKPIIMLADRQTTGGYTKIANVISADFRILAQLKAGDRVRFEKVSITTAQEALLAQRAALRCLRGAMNR